MYLFLGKGTIRERIRTMRTVDGVYTSAKIFTDTIEEYATAQIQMLCDNPAFEGCKVRVMPDVHPGKVGTIGFTSTVGRKVLPNVVGIDIGCGMLLAKLKQKKAEFQKLDRVIRENVPAGFQIRKTPHRFSEGIKLENLHCGRSLQIDKAKRSIGTLGGGNHFIELDQDEEGTLYVAIHTGSRHLGKEVTEYYLREGQRYLKERGLEIPYELTSLEGSLKELYLEDMQVVQQFAQINREAILDELVKGMKWKVQEFYDVAHNYIELGNEPMLRKGAISAKTGETVIIPIHMKEGILLGTGKGNQEWNQSAPHGSGRRIKREEVKHLVTVSDFKREMKGIYSSCIGKDTLDESPFAYRSMAEIQREINETVQINRVLKPIYNFKAGGE